MIVGFGGKFVGDGGEEIVCNWIKCYKNYKSSKKFFTFKYESNSF